MRLLASYAQMRQQLDSGFRVAAGVVRERGNGRAEAALAEAVEKLDANRFHLVVLGQFKRGKTTFLNALLGERLLPVGVAPTTSVITTLAYGEDRGALVIYLDGRVETIPIEDVPLYVTEKENPENVRRVKEVSLRSPSPFLQEDVLLIDTPGVGSTIEVNTQITYDFFPKVDAALFLVGADPPISKSEFEFLRDVREHVGKVFFVLNKIDYLSEEEWKESLEFSRSVICRQMDVPHVAVHPLSAKLALEGRLAGDPALVERSRLAALEEVLGRFLLEEKGWWVLRSAVMGLLRVARDELVAIEVERRLATTPPLVLEEKVAQFRDKMKLVERDRKDAHFLFQGEIEGLVRALEADLEAFKKRHASETLRALAEEAREGAGLDAREFRARLAAFAEASVPAPFAGWLDSETAKLSADYVRVTGRFARGTNETLDAIRRISAEVFEIRLPRIDVVETMGEAPEVDTSFGAAPDFMDFGGIARLVEDRLLPASWSHRRIARELGRRIPEIVDRNCGRMRFALVDRVQKGAARFRKDLDEKIRETVENLDAAIARASEMKAASQEEADRATARLDVQRNVLEHVAHCAGLQKRVIEAQADGG